METIARLLAALAEAARHDHKSEFDRLERELLTNFDGSFDAMPRDVYEQYLEVDRLWPVVLPPTTGDDASFDAARELHAVQVGLSAYDDAFLRQLGTEVDRSTSAVLAACVDLIRAEPALRQAVVQRLRAAASEEGQEDDSDASGD